MYLGHIFIDADAINSFFINQSTWEIFFQFLAIGGWLFFFYFLFFAGKFFWIEYKESRYTDSWKWVLLAVDAPQLNLQTPKAVEQLFAHLSGALDHENIAHKFWSGTKQRYFSFEIISIDGYIQFLIRTENTFRDLVEAAVYAQYPEAEIIEVEDYAADAPAFISATHDLWGADFTLTENDAYPLRTYRDFEHNITKDAILKDPMSAFLESFSRIGPGEQVWFQIIIQPTGNDWKEKAIAEIKEVIGDTGSSGHSSHSILDTIAAAPIKLLEELGNHILGRETIISESHEESGPPNQLQYLTPGATKLVEAMEAKISKVGFKTKMRGIYLARKEIFRPERGAASLIGAINQFNVPNANSLAPTFGVNLSYFGKDRRIARRKRVLLEAYKKRKMNVGGNAFILNIEELATIWHFPMSYVKTPLLQKSTAKRSEPPASLPTEPVALPVEEKNTPDKPPMRFG